VKSIDASLEGVNEFRKHDWYVVAGFSPRSTRSKRMRAKARDDMQFTHIFFVPADSVIAITRKSTRNYPIERYG
jgi:hypothetical protein